MIARRIIFAESLRVFRGVFRWALLLAGMFVAFMVASICFGDTDGSNWLKSQNAEDRTFLQSALISGYFWTTFFTWKAMTFAAYRLHLGLEHLERKELLFRFLNFLAGAWVLEIACRKVTNWILSPLPDLMLLGAHRDFTRPFYVPVAESLEWFLTIVLFCILGTWLPALILKKDLSVLATLQRGCRQFFWTLGQFLLGPGLFVVAGLAFWGFARLLEFTPEAVNSAVAMSTFQIIAVPVIFVVCTIISLSVLFCSVMAVVILSQALLRDENRVIVTSIGSADSTQRTRFSTLWKVA